MNVTFKPSVLAEVLVTADNVKGPALVRIAQIIPGSVNTISYAVGSYALILEDHMLVFVNGMPRVVEKPFLPWYKVAYVPVGFKITLEALET